MSWKPTSDIDQEVRRWMKAKDWEVTRTNYDFDREVYAWRHDLRRYLSWCELDLIPEAERRTL